MSFQFESRCGECEVCNRRVEVARSRLNALMPEEALDGLEVYTPSHQQRGVCVAENMRA